MLEQAAAASAELAAAECMGGWLGRVLRILLLGPDGGEARTAPGKRWEHQLAPHALARNAPLFRGPDLVD